MTDAVQEKERGWTTMPVRLALKKELERLAAEFGTNPTRYLEELIRRDVDRKPPAAPASTAG